MTKTTVFCMHFFLLSLQWNIYLLGERQRKHSRYSFDQPKPAGKRHWQKTRTRQLTTSKKKEINHKIVHISSKFDWHLPWSSSHIHTHTSIKPSTHWDDISMSMRLIRPFSISLSLFVWIDCVAVTHCHCAVDRLARKCTLSGEKTMSILSHFESTTTCGWTELRRKKKPCTRSKPCSVPFLDLCIHTLYLCHARPSH